MEIWFIMAPNYGPKITLDGLLLCYDAANRKSYPGTGTMWFDISKNVIHGTLTNSPVFSSNSFSFDGQDDYVSISSPSRLLAWTPAGTTGNRILTFETIVRTSDSAGQIFSKPWNGSGEYNYRLSASTFTTQVANTTVAHSLSFPSIADNNWKHIVAIANPTQKAVYVNGNIVAGFTNHGEASDTPLGGDASLPLALMTLFPYGQGAGSWPQPTHAVQGNMSLFKIYNRQLSDIEIRSNYNAYKSRYGL
jgi:hypothetical protein